MNRERFKKAVQVSLGCSVASVFITFVLTFVSWQATEGHPYPDEPEMLSFLLFVLFGGISLCLIVVTAVLYKEFRSR